MCPDVRAHWRNLTNTIEPSVCGGDAVSFQITLTKSCFCELQSSDSEPVFTALYTIIQLYIGNCLVLLASEI